MSHESYPLKYARIESERRFLVRSIPDRVASSADIVGRYIDGTHLRLREIREADGGVVRKLGHKARVDGSVDHIACTSIYVDDHEWRLLWGLPATAVRKTRHWLPDSSTVVDEYEDGVLSAEIDGGRELAEVILTELDIVREVTSEEALTGAGRALAIGSRD